MAQEFKTIKDSLFKILSGSVVRDTTDDALDDDDGSTASGRALIAALFARAGKGKDEVIQILARETGNAVAAMLKEPLSQLAKNQKLQISFEFVPKEADTGQNLRDETVDKATPGRRARTKKSPLARAAATKKARRKAAAKPATSSVSDEE